MYIYYNTYVEVCISSIKSYQPIASRIIIENAMLDISHLYHKPCDICPKGEGRAH